MPVAKKGKSKDKKKKYSYQKPSKKKIKGGGKKKVRRSRKTKSKDKKKNKKKLVQKGGVPEEEEDEYDPESDPEKLAYIPEFVFYSKDNKNYLDLVHQDLEIYKELLKYLKQKKLQIRELFQIQKLDENDRIHICKILKLTNKTPTDISFKKARLKSLFEAQKNKYKSLKEYLHRNNLKIETLEEIKLLEEAKRKELYKILELPDKKKTPEDLHYENKRLKESIERIKEIKSAQSIEETVTETETETET
jgi:hypothetical protein